MIEKNGGEDEYLSELHAKASTNYKDTPQYQFSVVVAIDFGTTFSGYAYSFTHDPENIHIMRKWEGKKIILTNLNHYFNLHVCLSSIHPIITAFHLVNSTM